MECAGSDDQPENQPGQADNPHPQHDANGLDPPEGRPPSGSRLRARGDLLEGLLLNHTSLHQVRYVTGSRRGGTGSCIAPPQSPYVLEYHSA